MNCIDLSDNQEVNKTFSYDFIKKKNKHEERDRQKIDKMTATEWLTAHSYV